ncbi:protein root UVB sensitive 5-like isoform X1 [Magnolia sinica]|uniref:protein root UVB sensitive 5-like isoform X1 n=1 Tax=Magnolia sinica TaxID=86752 RepID=UPI00265A204D|nr:protein root UVB sensitive 5-like isoform X1 [Magnolia sinica]XP_058105062.1 protein root UVB sensitive 5-like isoform X1 [Magnolia sinica]XP_058105063.1 protein root UVB sensitive 5-like isoform X1 [Magnolia sinica]XP_058105064.1 protein root UVB sensitive 5-like isoform X1 [Magnolia sinica]
MLKLWNNLPNWDCEHCLAWHELNVKINAINAATEAVCLILSTDETVKTQVKDLLELYAKEHHILVMSKPQQLRKLEIFVSFRVGATSMTVLRSLWQAYWLHEHWGGSDHALVQLRKSLFV